MTPGFAAGRASASEERCNKVEERDMFLLHSIVINSLLLPA